MIYTSLSKSLSGGETGTLEKVNVIHLETIFINKLRLFGFEGLQC